MILADRGLFRHLSVSQAVEDRWQASFKNPTDNAYSVSIKDDMIEAILCAVGPHWGHEWPELLGEEYSHLFDGIEPEEDEDDLEDVLG